MRHLATLAGVLAITAIAVAGARAQQAPPLPGSCDDQLKIVLKHDQIIAEQRQNLEVRTANLAAQVDDLTTKLHAAEAKVAKLEKDAKAPKAAEAKPAEPKK